MQPPCELWLWLDENDVVLKGESASYLGPAVRHSTKKYHGWGRWFASKQVVVIALFYEAFTETVRSEKERILDTQ